jgi:hypothetical protein
VQIFFRLGASFEKIPRMFILQPMTTGNVKLQFSLELIVLKADEFGSLRLWRPGAALRLI